MSPLITVSSMKSVTLSGLLFYLHFLEQCLANSEHTVNICWLNGKVNEYAKAEVVSQEGYFLSASLEENVEIF